MTNTIKAAKAWYNESYRNSGVFAQRRYPNEELLRFFGRHYFPMSAVQRRATRVLEMGCGSGANLWMMAREGFDSHGVDLSYEAIGLCSQMLESDGLTATLSTASMTACPYPTGSFDLVADVFSSYCLDEAGFATFLDEISRLLRPGGRFFSYTPSKASDAFRNPGPSQRLDASTLNGVHRETSPFYGNSYPFRFVTGEEYQSALAVRGLQIVYNEKVGRTYSSGREYFEFIVIAAESR